MKIFILEFKDENLAEIIYPYDEAIVSIIRRIKENSAEAKVEGSFLPIDEIPEGPINMVILNPNDKKSIYVTAFLLLDDIPELVTALEELDFEITQTNCVPSNENDLLEEGILEDFDKMSLN